MNKSKTTYRIVFVCLYAYETQLMMKFSLKLQSAPLIKASDMLESFQRRKKNGSNVAVLFVHWPNATCGCRLIKCHKIITDSGAQIRDRELFKDLYYSHSQSNVLHLDSAIDRHGWGNKWKFEDLKVIHKDIQGSNIFPTTTVLQLHPHQQAYNSWMY